jgi:hypothetical protein
MVQRLKFLVALANFIFVAQADRMEEVLALDEDGRF